MSKEDTEGKVVRDIDVTPGPLRTLPEAEQPRVAGGTALRGLSDLDYDQEQRVRALQAAREVVLSRQAFSSGVADVSDLMRVARYIITGQDPWDTAQKEEG